MAWYHHVLPRDAAAKVLDHVTQIESGMPPFARSHSARDYDEVTMALLVVVTRRLRQNRNEDVRFMRAVTKALAGSGTPGLEKIVDAELLKE